MDDNKLNDDQGIRVGDQGGVSKEVKRGSFDEELGVPGTAGERTKTAGETDVMKTAPPMPEESREKTVTKDELLAESEKEGGVKGDLIVKEELKDDLAGGESQEREELEKGHQEMSGLLGVKEDMERGKVEMEKKDTSFDTGGEIGRTEVVEKKTEESVIGGGVSSDPAVKVPEGFVAKPSGGDIGVRGEAIKTEEKPKKGFPAWIVVVFLVLLFGGLVALIFLNPLVEKEEEREMRMEVGEKTSEESEASLSGQIAEGTEGGGTGKGGLEAKEGSYVSEELGFAVKYMDERQVMEDNNSKAGNRVVFWLSSGLNFVVHAGKEWSYPNPERVEEAYTSTIAGVKAYEFGGDVNQKIVDFEKGEMKYTIQCVHQRNEAVLKECSDFLSSFRFLE